MNAAQFAGLTADGGRLTAGKELLACGASLCPICRSETLSRRRAASRVAVFSGRQPSPVGRQPQQGVAR